MVGLNVPKPLNPKLQVYWSTKSRDIKNMIWQQPFCFCFDFPSYTLYSVCYEWIKADVGLEARTPSCCCGSWQNHCSENLNTSPWPWSYRESDFQLNLILHCCPELQPDVLIKISVCWHSVLPSMTFSSQFGFFEKLLSWQKLWHYLTPFMTKFDFT